MKTIVVLTRLIFIEMQTMQRIIALALIALWLSACSEKTAPTEVPATHTTVAAPLPDETQAPSQTEILANARHSAKAKADAADIPDRFVQYYEVLKSDTMHRAPATIQAPAQETDKINSYLVKVEANKEIKMSIDSDKPTSGQLLVWIGQFQYEPQTLTGMSAASSILQTGVPATSAKITPSFPDDPSAFKVKPEASPCQGIDPTGTIVPFTITPTRAGQFRVGASVELYMNHGCQGESLTKTAEPITVKVTIFAPTDDLYQIAWSKFKEFFKEILGALFLVLGIIFRKRLKKLLGIKE
jgi:hypothetical protein